MPVRAFPYLVFFSFPLLSVFERTETLASVSHCPLLLELEEDPPIAKLTDPFTFYNGRKVLSQLDWACRRKEISALVQKYELGELPTDLGTTSAFLDGTKLSVTVTKNGRKISFISTIHLPTNSGEGPFPAIIGLGQTPSFPIPPGVAVIVSQSDMIASQQALFSRGYGLFYDIHGINHSAGAMAAEEKVRLFNGIRGCDCRGIRESVFEG